MRPLPPLRCGQWVCGKLLLALAAVTVAVRTRGAAAQAEAAGVDAAAAIAPASPPAAPAEPAAAWTDVPVAPLEAGSPPPQQPAELVVIEQHSFVPPFRSFDRDGMRELSSWQYGGAAALSEFFVRLTPDRQGRVGWLWNTAPVQTPTWSATMRFRVSGQGKKLFGDGLAVWFTRHSQFAPGPVHGFADTFRGFGVVLDTYLNAGSGRMHRDVLLLASDGSGPVVADHGGAAAASRPGIIVDGCDADFRYWEGRHDFTIANHSALRISLRYNQISVHIDPRGDGGWRTCLANVTLPLPPDWTYASGGSAFLGLTASTGDLADNHDVLSLQTTLEDAPTRDITDAARPAMISSGSASVDAAIVSAVTREMSLVDDKVALLHHHMDHQLRAMRDDISAALKLLAKQEGDSKARIVALEARVGEMIGSRVETTLAERIAALEQRLNAVVAGKLAAEVPALQQRFEVGQRSWVWPFAALAVAVVAAVVVGFRKYRYLLAKDHLP